MDYVLEFSVMCDIYDELTGYSEANEGVKEAFSKIGGALKTAWEKVCEFFRWIGKLIGDLIDKIKGTKFKADPAVAAQAEKDATQLATISRETSQYAIVLSQRAKAGKDVEDLIPKLEGPTNKILMLEDKVQAYCQKNHITYDNYMAFVQQALVKREGDRTEKLMLTVADDLDRASTQIVPVVAQDSSAAQALANSMMKASSEIRNINAKIFKPHISETRGEGVILLGGVDVHNQDVNVPSRAKVAYGANDPAAVRNKQTAAAFAAL